MVIIEEQVAKFIYTLECNVRNVRKYVKKNMCMQSLVIQNKYTL